MHKFIPFLLVVFTFVFSGSKTVAQNKEGANWMFGSKFHLDFNKAKPEVSNFSFVDTTALGVATISDKNGELLFFSSGGRVATRLKVNGEYQEMPNGDLIKLSPIYGPTSAEMIVQSPADPEVYYLFFIGEPYDPTTPSPIQKLYSVQIDIRLNNGYGDVVPGSLQEIRRDVNPMKLTALLHSNNRDTWILTQNSFHVAISDDSLAANLLTPGGILPAVVTKSAKPLGIHSRMKASPNSEMFVVQGREWNLPPEHPNRRELEVFNFDRSTGVISNKYSFPSPDPSYSLVSFAFSPDNTKLYAGTSGNNIMPRIATLYQYDLAAGNAAQVQNSRNVIYQTTDYYAVSDIQLAIDGKLYLIIEADSFNNSKYEWVYKNRYLSKINCPNFYGADCRFEFQGIDMKMTNAKSSLPALNQTIFRNAGKLQAQAYRETICAGDTVQLTAYGAGAEQFKWEVGNGLSSSSVALANPVVNPTVTTTYKVTGYSVCSSDSAFVTVTVLPKIPGGKVSGPLQVVTLTEHEYLVQNPTPGSTFNWQVTGGNIASGQGTSSITVNWGAAGEGTVSVFEDPETGCNGETVSLKVQIAESPEPVIYNVFTPNNDGRNDAFVIENLKWYPENELRIYNRWGVEVYKTSNYENNWKADKVSAGTYYYFFKANGRSWKGWVEVMK